MLNDLRIAVHNTKVRYYRLRLSILNVIQSILVSIHTRILLWLMKSPRQQQKIIKNMFKKLFQFIAAVIIIYIIARFVWYWGFVRPNIRDQTEGAKYQVWQQQVADYKNEP